VSKARVIASIAWEIDIPEDGDLKRAAKEYLLNILPAEFEIHVAKTNLHRQKKSHLQQLGAFSLDEVFAKLTTCENRVPFVVEDKTHLVRMNSHRYFVFKHNPSCVACGLVGSKFILEQHPNDKTPHFNLYGEEAGHMILLTKDHIHAKSHGGEDRHSNYQTMCAVCNNLKADLHIPLAGIAELRRLFDENKNILTRKKLNGLLHDARRRLVVPLHEPQPSEGVCLNVDIALLKTESGLQGLSIYEAEGKSMEYVACLRKGTRIYPIEVRDKKLIVPLETLQFELHQGFTETCFSSAQTPEVVV
jgi:5-methylcytosine-specific restriction endonuclease McrA